jgi:uncharacterized protein YndB with AHSA1/START domain
MDNNRQKELIIERIFDVPRESVWKAWTDPDLIKKWWGPEGFSAPSIKVDLKIGGKYIFAMQGPKGSEWDKIMYSGGVYKEIIPNEKLVVTDYFSDEFGEKKNPADFGQDPNFPYENTVTVLFEEIEVGKTKLSIIYPMPESEAQKEAMLKSGMKEGWQSSLNKLAESIKL